MKRFIQKRRVLKILNGLIKEIGILEMEIDKLNKSDIIIYCACGKNVIEHLRERLVKKYSEYRVYSLLYGVIVKGRM